MKRKVDAGHTLEHSLYRNCIEEGGGVTSVYVRPCPVLFGFYETTNVFFWDISGHWRTRTEIGGLGRTSTDIGGLKFFDLKVELSSSCCKGEACLPRLHKKGEPSSPKLFIEG